MKVRLAADYRGVLTNEAYYPAGVYVVGGDMNADHAAALIEAGRAVVVETVRAGTEETTAPPARKPRGKK